MKITCIVLAIEDVEIRMMAVSPFPFIGVFYTFGEVPETISGKLKKGQLVNIEHDIVTGKYNLFTHEK